MTTNRIFLNKEMDREWKSEMVIIPKRMALDLIHYLNGTGCFIAEMSNDQCDADLHEKASEKNVEKMKQIADFVMDRLCTSDINPNAENTLSLMSSLYEVDEQMKAFELEEA